MRFLPLLLKSKQGTLLKQRWMSSPPPPEPDEGVTAVMAHEPSSLREQSLKRILKNVFGSLDTEGSEPATVPSEIGQEVGPKVGATNKILESKDLNAEVQAHEVIEVMSGNEEMPQLIGRTNAQVFKSPEGPITNVEEDREAHTSTLPTIINIPPTPFFGISHLSPARPASRSPYFFEQYKPQRLVTSPILMDSSSSSQLTSDNHPFFRDLHPLSPKLKSFYDQVLITEGDILKSVPLYGLSPNCFFLRLSMVLL